MLSVVPAAAFHATGARGSDANFDFAAASGGREYCLLRRVDRMYAMLFGKDATSPWSGMTPLQALLVVFKVADALQVMLSSMDEEFCELNAGRKKTTPRRVRKYVDDEAEE